MRWSEALMTGSLLIKPLAGKFLSDDKTEGCALGMVNEAVGDARFNEEYRKLCELRPTQPCDCKEQGVMSCGCRYIQRVEAMRNASTIVTHLFNYHVMTKKDWTIERLAEWLEQIQPREVAQEAPAPEQVSTVEASA